MQCKKKVQRGPGAWAGLLVIKHLALLSWADSTWLSGGIITSIMRGNIFLRHFGYANIWHCWSHMSVCECACQWGKRTAHTSTSHINIGVYFKKEIQIFPVFCKNLETVLLWTDRPSFSPSGSSQVDAPVITNLGIAQTACLTPSTGHKSRFKGAWLEVEGNFWFFSGAFWVGGWGGGSVKWSVAGLGEGQTA